MPDTYLESFKKTDDVLTIFDELDDFCQKIVLKFIKESTRDNNLKYPLLLPQGPKLENL